MTGLYVEKIGWGATSIGGKLVQPRSRLRNYPMSLSFVLYRSQAKIPRASLEETTLILDARAANRDHGITGYLYREGDVFAQYLEGEDAIVRKLYGSIRRDIRHEGVMLLADEAIETRTYVDWPMGFAELPTTGKSKIGGTKDDVLHFFGLNLGDPAS